MSVTASKTTTKLYFTRNSPLRSTIVDEKTQRPLFQLETPRKVGRQTTRIRKVPENEESAHLLSPADEDDDSDSDETIIQPKKDGESETEPDDIDENDISAPDDEIARIHWHTFRSHRVVFKGQILKRSDILPKSGLSYTFKVGGTEVKWNLGLLGVSAPKLILNNRYHNNTVIAQFHRKNMLNRADKSYLEVSADGMEIIDHIILTFVFVEKKRRDRMKRTRYGYGHISGWSGVGQ